MSVVFLRRAMERVSRSTENVIYSLYLVAAWVLFLILGMETSQEDSPVPAEDTAGIGIAELVPDMTLSRQRDPS